MLDNLDASPSSIKAKSAVCTLCGLMCDLSLPKIGGCDRRKRWLELAVPRSRGASDLSECLGSLKLDSGTLIWLDACDVQTTRAAIQLAQRVGATIHVGQSTGSHATKKVVSSGGWLGTTLSEISARADLIVTLGDGVRREAPLLSERFFQSQNRSVQPHWIHISQHVGDWGTSSIRPHEVIHWPRTQWFDSLSQLAMQLLSNRNTVHNVAEQRELPGIQPPSSNQNLVQLASQLAAAKQTVWLWDVDELHFQSDELIVRRMLSIAQTLSEQTRCNLLPLDLNIGRVTAEETLLWLTGCPTTATWDGVRWFRSPRYADYSLEQWSAAFSTIVLVSSLASDRSLPNLPASITLQTMPTNQKHEFQVAATGRDCSGHLFRGDRGVVLFAESTTSSELPTAVELLTQLMENAVVN